jgi:hypothetical protein
MAVWSCNSATTERHVLTTYGIPALLLLMTVAVFGRVLHHEFLPTWDDLNYVVNNDAIRGFSWQHVKTAFSSFYLGNYAPLHILSYVLDYSLWGLNPAGFLATNVLLHAANGCIFFYLVMWFGLNRIGALFAAGIFLLHPVQVESVAWVSERKNLLCMTFSLASLHGFVSYRQQEGGPNWTAYAGALLWFFAALLTKAIAVVVPVVLVLIDFCAIPEERRMHPFRDKIPFFLAAIVLSIFTLVGRRAIVAEGHDAYLMDSATTLFTMVPVIVKYIAMLFWPVGLSAVYTPTVRQSADPTFWLSLSCLALIAMAGVLLWKRHRQLFLWYSLFFVALIPVLQIEPLPTLMNDRYLYFPMIGAAALAGFGFERGFAVKELRWRQALVMFAVAVSLALGCASFVRAAVWKDDVTLWQDATEKTPKSTLAWLQLGNSLSGTGRYAEAISAYRKAIDENPSYVMALNNLGRAYNTIGQPEQGRVYLFRALQVDPQHYTAYMNLGTGFLLSGDRARAERAFSLALSVRPQSQEAKDALRKLSVR